MDKKFMISVVLSFATIAALQYFWHKSPTGSGEVTVQNVQQQPKPGEAIKVPVKEDLYKPMQVGVSFVENNAETAPDVTVNTPFVEAIVSSRAGALTGLKFKECLGKGKKPMETVSVGLVSEKGEKSVADGYGSFVVAFEGAAPLNYAIVADDNASGPKQIAVRAMHEGWEITKRYSFDAYSYRVDFSLDLVRKNSDAASIKPRILVDAPVTQELGEVPLSTFVFNEHRNKIEKKDPGAEEGLIWFWQTAATMVGSQSKYFIHALTADKEKFVQRAYFNRSLEQKNLSLILEGPMVQESQSWNLSFYMGPKILKEMVKVDSRLEDVFVSGFFAWMTKLLVRFLEYIKQFIENFGLAIVVLAVALKLPLVPLSIYSRIKTDAYQKHAPIIARIRAKYKGDKQAEFQEITRYHQEHNLSQATQMLGCLPMLLQIPIMVSLYDILANNIHLYQAPFFGWIVDLSAKDPFYVIPVLMGVTMIWQQSMATMSDEKQRIVMFFVSIVMTVVFAGLPVGLVLYWLVSNILSIIEDYARRWFFA